ncbi:MAG: aminotransferase class V-fold PLP-dependent enzyme [Ferruginibacter sp.]|nr:aminotransferase class V-fold PLP-dependent enzyme [Cytophagales bacterium]
MKNTYFTPGPAQLYPSVARHVQTALDEQIGSLSHRSQGFRRIYQHTADQLREMLRIPDGSGIFFLGSATEVWERVLQNCVERESFHLVNGSFSGRFHAFARELGKHATQVEAPFGEGFNAGDAPVPETAELVCLTHNETSSGVSMPVAEMHALRSAHPGRLFVVDAVSSAPYPDLDLKLIDSVFFSVQKAFGLPAGLGVWIANERMLAKAEQLAAKGISIGTYHSLPSLFKNFRNYETPETPNVMNIYLLGKVAEEMNRQGIGAIRRETEAKAQRLYDFLDRSASFDVFVRNPAHRSQTVIVGSVAPRQSSQPKTATQVIEALKAAGIVVGGGYGSYRNQHIRIANFPATSTEEVERLVRELGKV